MFRKALLLLPLCAACSTTQGPSPVTPQRPFLSRTAETTADGTVELETGFQARPDKLFRLPTLLKFGATPNTELFFGASLYDHYTLPGSNATGFGDLTVGTRTRVLDESEKTPSYAFAVEAKLPTGGSAVSTGEQDFYGTFIVGKTYVKIAFVGNYRLGVLGDPVNTGSDLEHGLFVRGRGWIDEKLSVAGELDGQFASGDYEDIIQTIWSVGYLMNPSLMFDVGLSLGLNSAAQDYVILAGFTTNFGGIF